MFLPSGGRLGDGEVRDDERGGGDMVRYRSSE